MSPEGPLPARLLSSNSRASACTSRSMPARTAWYCPSPAPASMQLSPYQNTGVEQGNCSTRQELAFANLVTFRSCFTFASGQQLAEIDGRRARHLMGQPDSQGYPMRCVGASSSSSARPHSQACLQQHETLGSQPLPQIHSLSPAHPASTAAAIKDRDASAVSWGILASTTHK